MNWIRRTGAEFLTPAFERAGFGVWLAGRSLLLLPHLLPRRRSFLDQLYLAGVKSLHVTLFVAFFVGMIVAMQVGIELARFGQQELIGPLVAESLTREMAPFVTCVILAASVASAMAAELGTMRVQEELTALEVMSVDTVSFLVVPRVFALTLMAPVLTFLADVVGILGGGVIAGTQLGLDFTGYLNAVLEQLAGTDVLGLPHSLYSGLLKALVFGFTIAVVGCASGMGARGGAAGVGQTTRSAVRNSIILIIVLNFFLGKALHP